MIDIHQKKGITALLVITLLFIVLSGCTQQQTNEQPTTTIQDILDRVNTITSMYCEITGTTTMNGAPMNMSSSYKIWEKSPYVKFELSMFGINMTLIVRPNGTFMYNPITENYTQMPAGYTTTQKTIQNLIGELKTQPTLTVVGTDTVDGKAVTIVEYTQDTNLSQTLQKLWIWDEYGVPLKVEMTTTAPGTGMTTVMTMEYTNYSFDDIPDSTFDVT